MKKFLVCMLTLISYLLQGKFIFNMDEEPDRIIFELETPKNLETDLIDVDVNPYYVRVVAKEKLTQLKLPAEVDVAGSTVQRSKTTGFLKVVMPKSDVHNHGHSKKGSFAESSVHAKCADKWGKRGPSEAVVAGEQQALEALKPDSEKVPLEGDSAISSLDGVSSSTIATGGSSSSSTIPKTSINGKKATTKESSPIKPKITNIFELHADPIKRESNAAGSNVPGSKSLAKGSLANIVSTNEAVKKKGTRYCKAGSGTTGTKSGVANTSAPTGSATEREIDNLLAGLSGGAGSGGKSCSGIAGGNKGTDGGINLIQEIENDSSERERIKAAFLMD